MPDEGWRTLQALFGLIGALASVWAGLKAKAAHTQSKRNSEELSAVHEQVNGNTKKALAEAEERGRRTSPPQILIVDDNPNDLELMTHKFKHFGADVFGLTSANAVETLLRSRIGPARGYPFDLVLVDLRMPHGDADKTMRLLKERAPGVRRCVITGGGDSPVTLAPYQPFIFLTKDQFDEDVIAELLTEAQVPFKRQ